MADNNENQDIIGDLYDDNVEEAMGHDPKNAEAQAVAAADKAGAGFTVNSDSDSALRNVKLVLDASGASLSDADTFSIARTGDGNVTIDNGSGDDVTF